MQKAPLPIAGRRIVLCALLSMLLPWAAADDQPVSSDVTRLENYLSELQSLRADFTQQVFNRDAELVESASGRLALLKPGRFRWDYLQPFERVIVADGERVWLYEADLDQVTVQRLDEGLGETPAALLSGSVDILQRFDYRGSETREEMTWLRLGPRGESTDFDEIRLGFSGQQLIQMELADRLGQTTQVSFSNIDLNPGIDASVFSFEVPPGADVIGEDEL
jgi:outer membrane lipoprotein carrier protein